MSPDYRARSATLRTALLGAVVVAGAVAAAEAQPDYTRGCTSSGCHADLKQAAVVHAPVSAAECDACHQPAGSNAHRFEFTVDKQELCIECHDEEDYEGSTVHAPVSQGQCTACHDPHRSAHRFLLNSAPRDLCTECHESVTEDLESLHGPLASGECTACHKAHVSEHKGLLTVSGSKLCLECHEDMGERLEDSKYVHDPVRENCQGCHNPHGGQDRMNLLTKQPELCYECHDEIAEAVEDAGIVHNAVNTPKSCGLCHDPHAADRQHQLLRPDKAMCLDCHNKQVTSGQRTIQNVAQLLADHPTHHGPIASDQCAACHNPHGGSQRSFLSGTYPTRFYSKFDEGVYGLCFECHDVEAFEEPRTDDLTAFRNGDRNLHHLHVNRQDKGRTCRACHDTHATTNPRLIADSVPFGNWRIPLNFEKTATGGSCLPGCHRAYRYDRQSAVANLPP